MMGENNPLPLQLRVFKIDDKTKSKFADTKIVQHLATFMICYTANNFGINDDIPVCNEIGDILSHFDISVQDRKPLLLRVFNTTVRKFDNERIFIGFFMKSMSQTIEHLDRASYNLKNLVFENHSFLKNSRLFASIRG